MSELPPPPENALTADEHRRFIYACSHERHSPSTKRLIDAPSYEWIYQFIQNHGEEAPPIPAETDWLDPGDADPQKLSDYFGRVAIRLRNPETHDYATTLEKHFEGLADIVESPSPDYSSET